jgi:hypothetical protein
VSLLQEVVKMAVPPPGTQRVLKQEVTGGFAVSVARLVEEMARPRLTAKAQEAETVPGVCQLTGFEPAAGQARQREIRSLFLCSQCSMCSMAEKAAYGLGWKSSRERPRCVAAQAGERPGCDGEERERAVATIPPRGHDGAREEEPLRDIEVEACYAEDNMAVVHA